MHGCALHGIASIGITLACHAALVCNANPSDDRTDSPSRQRVESAGLAHDFRAKCCRDRKKHDLTPILGEPACRTAYTTCLDSINPAHSLALRRFSESVLNQNSMPSSLLSVGYLLRHPNRMRNHDCGYHECALDLRNDMCAENTPLTLSSSIALWSFGKLSRCCDKM